VKELRYMLCEEISEKEPLPVYA